jgi:hypothetical protein
MGSFGFLRACGEAISGLLPGNPAASPEVRAGTVELTEPRCTHKKTTVERTDCQWSASNSQSPGKKAKKVLHCLPRKKGGQKLGKDM